MRHERAWANKTAWKLYKENWQLCKDIVAERDGKKCILCGTKSDLQLDHCITRSRKSVFFETQLLNYLCSRCHSSKSFQNGGPTDKIVDLKTMRRIGKPEYEDLIAKSQELCPQFRRVWFQEEINEYLKEKLEYWKVRTE